MNIRIYFIEEEHSQYVGSWTEKALKLGTFTEIKIFQHKKYHRRECIIVRVDICNPAVSMHKILKNNKSFTLVCLYYHIAISSFIVCRPSYSLFSSIDAHNIIKAFSYSCSVLDHACYLAIMPITYPQWIFPIGIKNPLANPAILATTDEIRNADLGKVIIKAVNKAVQVRLREKFTTNTWM